MLAVVLSLFGFTPYNPAYNAIYLVLPLLLFLRETERKKTDPLYGTFYVLFFSPFPYQALERIGALTLRTEESFASPSLTMLIEGLLLLAFTATLLCETAAVAVCRLRASLRYQKWETSFKKTFLTADGRLPLSPNARFVSISLLTLTLFLAVAALYNRTSFGDFFLFLLYQVMCVLLPGYALLRLIRFRCRTIVETVGFSYALGYALGIVTYLLPSPLHHFTDAWMAAIPVIQYVLAIAACIFVVLDLRRAPTYRVTDEDIQRNDRTVFFTVWIGVFLLYFLTFGISNRLPGLETRAYYGDTFYWVGNTISLSRSFPPESIRGLSEIIEYHYFSSIQLVTVAKTTGISIQTLSLAFSFAESSLLIAFGFFALFSALLRKNSKVMLAVLLLLFATGEYEKTSVYFISNMVIAPFGLDFGLGLLAFALLLLVRQYQAEKWLLRESALYLVLFAADLGTKAPLSVMLLFFEGLLCLYFLLLFVQICFIKLQEKISKVCFLQVVDREYFLFH